MMITMINFIIIVITHIIHIHHFSSSLVDDYLRYPITIVICRRNLCEVTHTNVVILSFSIEYYCYCFGFHYILYHLFGYFNYVTRFYYRLLLSICRFIFISILFILYFNSSIAIVSISLSTIELNSHDY